MKFKLGEMFCGPGGLALGAKNASIKARGKEWSIEHLWATDLDEPSCETFRKNICPDKPKSVIRRDVRKLKTDRLKKVDAFAFGFPCNDFSVVGEQRGINGEFGPLYSYGVNVLNRFKPSWFFAENVGGIRSADNGKTFYKILDDLKRAGPGYTLTTHLYRFEEYGVPQTRHRIIIVGIRKDLNLTFAVPSPTHSTPVTVKQALMDHPIPVDAANQELTRQSPIVVERLKLIKPGENVWNADLPDNLRLNVKGAKLSQIYRRLHPDKPSYTITGSGGGGTHGYHWKEYRALTNRERARLQTFPDDFIFIGAKEAVRKQIGMAVPPLAARVIFEAILKTFAGVSYQNVEANWKPGGNDDEDVKRKPKRL